MKATIVFEKTWNAINELKPDGDRKYKYIIHTGSSRSSKTFSILQTHWLICLSNPNTRVSIWRETKADCKMTILADLKKAVLNFPNNQMVSFNKTESIYTFPNGSTIEFMGGDEENRVHGFQGDVSHFNEPYNFGEEAFNQIDMRTSKYILIDWNPKKKHWIDELSKRDNAIVIHSTYKDNPFIPIEQKKKIQSYLPVHLTDVVLNKVIDLNTAKNYNILLNKNNLSEKHLKELEISLFNESQGTANEYLHLVYALGQKAEKPNRVFSGWRTISETDFNKLPYPSYFGLDFGLSAPCGLVECKWNGDNEIYLHERLYKPLNEIPTTLPEHLSNIGINKQAELVGDSGNELNKSEGGRLRNAGFNFFFAKKGGGSVVAGREILNKFKVYYTSTSKNLEEEYENHSWRVVQGIVLDEPEQGNDHLIDACCYVATFISNKFRLV